MTATKANGKRLTAMSSLRTSIAKPQGRSRRWRLPLLLAVLALVAIAAMGCGRGTWPFSQGSYPLDIFYEMHYQPAYKAHEPPRLSPPASAVPWYGATPPQPTSNAGSGKYLYATNCVMCHGVTGEGDGPVLARIIVDYGYQTTDAALLNPNLTSEAAKSVDRDGLRGAITGGVNLMPPFAKLLTPDQIELVLDYVQGCIQDGDAAACE